MLSYTLIHATTHTQDPNILYVHCIRRWVHTSTFACKRSLFSSFQAFHEAIYFSRAQSTFNALTYFCFVYTENCLYSEYKQMAVVGERARARRNRWHRCFGSCVTCWEMHIFVYPYLKSHSRYVLFLFFLVSLPLPLPLLLFRIGFYFCSLGLELCCCCCSPSWIGRIAYARLFG